MESKLERRPATFLGIFVLATLLLAGLGLFRIGAEEGWAGETIALESAMPSVQGLRVGVRVRALGMPVGRVIAIDAPQEPGQPVIVRFWIAGEHRQLVRANATTRLFKDGLVGERVLEIDPGDVSSAPIESGARLASAPGLHWEDVLAKVNTIIEDAQSGKGTVGKLLTDDKAFQDATALVRDAQMVVAKANLLVANAQSGKGTIGKLLTDDKMYQDVQGVLNHAEQTLSAVEENYSSVKQSWPLRRWVNDRYQLLVRPDMQTHRKVIHETDLFESGRAVLTEQGKVILDDVATWIHQFDDSGAEVVVAGFVADEPDNRLAELTSRKQAEAVLQYLTDVGTAHKTGWFTRRTIAAHGFGNLPNPQADTNVPNRRIEILAFVK